MATGRATMLWKFNFMPDGSIEPARQVNASDGSMTFSTIEAIDENRFLATAFFGYSGGQITRARFLIINTEDGTVRNLVTLPEHEWTQNHRLHRASQTLTIGVVPSPSVRETPQNSSLRVINLNTGAQLAEVPGLFASRGCEGQSQEDPVLYVNADNNLVRWEPWAGPPSAAPLGRVGDYLAAVCVEGGAVAVHGLASEDGGLGVYRLSTGERTLLVPADVLSTPGDLAVDTPLHLKADGSGLLVQRLISHGDVGGYGGVFVWTAAGRSDDRPTFNSAGPGQIMTGYEPAGDGGYTISLAVLGADEASIHTLCTLPGSASYARYLRPGWKPR